MKPFLLPALVIGASLSAQSVAAQSTDELLNSKTVKSFLVFKIDPGKKTVSYFIDDDAESRNVKQVRGKTCFAVAEKAHEKQVRLEMAFLNPFKYKIAVSDTTLTDPVYEAMSQYLDVIEGLSGQLVTGGATGGLAVNIPKSKAKIASNTTELTKLEEKAVKTLSSQKQLAITNKKRIEKAKFLNSRFDLLDQIDAPSLAAWVYQVQLGPARDSWLTSTMPEDTARAKAVLEKLGNSAKAYYQPDAADDNFMRRVKEALDEIAAANTFESLQKHHDEYNKAVAKLTEFNKQASATLTSFVEEQKKDLPGEKQLDNSAAVAFNVYSRREFADFEAKATAIQSKREQIVDVLKKLGAELDLIETEMNNKRTSYLMSTIFLTEEKMKEFTVSVRPRTIAISAEDGIVIDEGKAIVSEKLRLRTSKKLIPEFGTGVFYTNMEYVRYGIKTIGTDMFVEPATSTKVKAMLAAHLNLVINTWDGLVHPMLQIGAGTGKDAPSILAGGGLRFTQPKNLALTGGVVWNWQRDLNQLKVGDKIDGTAALESDLRLKLKSTPSMYLGIQFEF